MYIVGVSFGDFIVGYFVANIMFPVCSSFCLLNYICLTGSVGEINNATFKFVVG